MIRKIVLLKTLNGLLNLHRGSSSIIIPFNDFQQPLGYTVKFLTISNVQCIFICILFFKRYSLCILFQMPECSILNASILLCFIWRHIFFQDYVGKKWKAMKKSLCCLTRCTQKNHKWQHL